MVKNLLRAFLDDPSEVTNVLHKLKNGQHERPNKQRDEGDAPSPPHTFNNSFASAMPAAGRPYSLAVTRASATS